MYNWVVEILAFLDNQDLANAWTKTRIVSAGQSVAVAYFDNVAPEPGAISNYAISSTALGILRCPDDLNSQSGGNLSYVVNGGFSLWHALPIGWIGAPSDGASAPTAYDDSGLRMGPPEAGWNGNVAFASKLGVMFLQDYGPATSPSPAKMPWNLTSRINEIYDGASNTSS